LADGQFSVRKFEFATVNPKPIELHLCAEAGAQAYRNIGIYRFSTCAYVSDAPMWFKLKVQFADSTFFKLRQFVDLVDD